MIRTIARVLSGTLAVAALSATGSAAFAADGPSTADRKAAKSANKACAWLTDDVTWEACVTGGIARRTDRGVTFEDYAVRTTGNASNPTRVVMLNGTRSIKASAGKASASDRRALLDTNEACRYILGGKRKHVNRWLDCQVGMFTMITGKAITDADLVIKRDGQSLRMALTHKSHRITGFRPY